MLSSSRGPTGGLADRLTLLFVVTIVYLKTISIMKPETIRMLEEWRKNSFEPKQGIIVTRDYLCEDNDSIELMWFAEYTENGRTRIIKFIVKNIPDDIVSLNIQIDNIEKNELRKQF